MSTICNNNLVTFFHGKKVFVQTGSKSKTDIAQEIMQAIFDGSEVEDGIDWRPEETIPEDYYVY